MPSKFENPALLLKHLKRGDEEAYVYLIEKYHRLLFNYVISLTNDRFLAQDIIQETFMSIWKERKRLNESYSLKSYIYKITYNKFINQYHKHRAISSIERAYMEALNESVQDNDKELFEKKMALVSKVISDLPAKCKETFLLSKKEGLTNVEIAEYLNISLKTVEGHITKAFSILRKEVGNEAIALLLFWIL